MASSDRGGSPLDALMAAAGTVTRVFVRVIETGAALVGVIVLVYILLGEASGGFVISVVANLVLLVGALTPQALVGIAIVLALVYLLKPPPRPGSSRR